MWCWIVIASTAEAWFCAGAFMLWSPSNSLLLAIITIMPLFDAVEGHSILWHCCAPVHLSLYCTAIAGLETTWFLGLVKVLNNSPQVATRRQSFLQEFPQHGLHLFNPLRLSPFEYWCQLQHPRCGILSRQTIRQKGMQWLSILAQHHTMFTFVLIFHLKHKDYWNDSMTKTLPQGICCSQLGAARSWWEDNNSFDGDAFVVANEMCLTDLVSISSCMAQPHGTFKGLWSLNLYFIEDPYHSDNGDHEIYEWIVLSI